MKFQKSIKVFYVSTSAGASLVDVMKELDCKERELKVVKLARLLGIEVWNTGQYR